MEPFSFYPKCFLQPPSYLSLHLMQLRNDNRDSFFPAEVSDEKASNQLYSLKEGVGIHVSTHRVGTRLRWPCHLNVWNVLLCSFWTLWGPKVTSENHGQTSSEAFITHYLVSYGSSGISLSTCLGFQIQVKRERRRESSCKGKNYQKPKPRECSTGGKMVNFRGMQVQWLVQSFCGLMLKLGWVLGRNQDFKVGLGDWKSLKAQKGNLTY